MPLHMAPPHLILAVLLAFARKPVLKIAIAVVIAIIAETIITMKEQTGYGKGSAPTNKKCCSSSKVNEINNKQNDSL